MPTSYRIYTIGRGGHFLGAPEVVECTNDKEAVEKAMQVVNGFHAEIWDQRRFVARLPGSPPKTQGRVSRPWQLLSSPCQPQGEQTPWGSIFVANGQPT